MTLELIRTITLLCSVSSLENTKGAWAELPDTANYQHRCQLEYLGCMESNSGKIPVELISKRLVKCIKERKVEPSK
jgi:hypothetical protein